MPTHKCTFELKERLLLDNEISVLVQAVTFRLINRVPLYEVSYMHNGINYEIWVIEDRLSYK